jgi:putative ABC transport system substrate-binding protein
MIGRRTFIAGLGSAAAWPARAQQADRVRRIGVLIVGDENDPVQKTLVSAFTQALAGLGWSDVRMDVRWPGGEAELAPKRLQLLRELMPNAAV